MKKSVISALIFIFASQVMAARTQSEFKSYDLRTVDLMTHMRYFLAQGNFTKSGNSYDELPSGYGFEIFQFDFGARGALSSQVAAFAEATLAASQSKAPKDTRRNSAISEIQVGMDFLAMQGPLSLYPEISATIATEENSINSDVVAVSDGVASVNARLIALLKSRSLQYGGHAGFTYRDRGLSSLLSYGIFGEYGFRSGDIGADLRGYTSILNDTGDSETRRDAYQCRANGCAKKFLAVDPGLLEMNFYYRWRSSKTWDLKLGFGTDITGKNTATGTQFLVGYTYHFETATAAPVHPISTKNRRVTEPTFQEETEDGVDQTLFAPPEEPEDEGELIAPPVPTPTPRPAAPRPQKTREQIQNDLDRTEMQIELKSNKKKKRSQ